MTSYIDPGIPKLNMADFVGELRLFWLLWMICALNKCVTVLMVNVPVPVVKCLWTAHVCGSVLSDVYN